MNGDKIIDPVLLEEVSRNYGTAAKKIALRRLEIALSPFKTWPVLYQLDASAIRGKATSQPLPDPQMLLDAENILRSYLARIHRGPNPILITLEKRS